MDTSKCLSLAVVVVVLTTLQISFAFDKALERVKLEGHDIHDIDIYVERRISYLHSRIDLKTTYDGLLMLEKCSSRFGKSTNTPLSRALASHMNAKFDKISSKLTRVTERHSNKQKRSIEFIGDLWSDLFGNPGPSDWKQIK